MNHIDNFISDYITVTHKTSDRILAKELHEEYLQFSYGSLKQPIGPNKFYKRLRDTGISVRTGTANKMYVFGVISEWL